MRLRSKLKMIALLVAVGSVVADELSFNREVRPILSDKCFHCHGPDTHSRKAKLRLDTREGALVDLGGYAAIKPGSGGDMRSNHGGGRVLIPLALVPSR